MMVSWIVTSIISGINLLLIIGLLSVYVKNLIEIKSWFTIGLVLFGALFFIQNGILFYFSITMMPLYAEGIGTYMLILSILQTAAFAILNWVTWI